MVRWSHGRTLDGVDSLTIAGNEDGPFMSGKRERVVMVRARARIAITTNRHGAVRDS